MVSYDHYFHELQKQLVDAAGRGMTSVVISSAELNLAVGGPTGFMENCFEAMEAELEAGDEVLPGSESGSGMTVRYGLPRSPD
ncbi:MAG TPA: hypothetical protein VIQ29_25025 [Ancylobacter sp.]